jgi:hypothetical protein
MEIYIFNGEEDLIKSKINYVLIQSYNVIQEKLNFLKTSILNNNTNILNEKTPKKIKINKSGRCKKTEQKNKIISIHSKMSFDNILKKIKVMYHNFIIKFANNYIKFLYDGFQRYRLRKISGKITQNVTKKYNVSLSNITLKEFLSNKISPKYKQDKDKNKKIVEKLCSLKSEIKELFEMPYIIFYQKIFLCTNRTFLENKYGISKRTLTFDDNLQILNQTETVTYYKEVEKIGKKKFLEFLGYNINSKIEIELKDYNFIDNYKLSQKKYPLFEVKKD